MDALKNGRVVAIAPGGAPEALFSDKTYKLIWGHRKGFAQLAIDAKVSIIPMYTENIQEAYRMPNECRLIRWLHETFLWPVIPPYGGLPVKLHTHVGEPIPYDPDITAEELAKKTQTALQNLIQRHQQIPGSMWKALLARLDKPKKDD
ncbi:transmembrane protein 68-like [Alligator sinensis]|uniref:Transmembrane protein 68-like n=1 Tax=Alligator sinensis TaxID=38654 RepID=A0A3Q0FNW7_ALLSI|nr:transmembrane protein 68-like [Alligator sinensis]